MKNDEKIMLPSLFVFLAGVGLSLFLIVAAAWADMEATFYGFSRLAETGLRGLSCPVIMTRGETNLISLQVTNTNDSPISPSVKMQISTPLMVQESLESFRLERGATKRLEWPVGPANVDLQRFIFAKALMFSAYPSPSLEATCGIFIIGLPGKGSVILAVWVVLSLLGLGGGVYGLNRAGGMYQSLRFYIRAMTFLAIILVAGIAVSLMGGWVPSVMLLAVALLMIVILLSAFALRERKNR